MPQGSPPERHLPNFFRHLWTHLTEIIPPVVASPVGQTSYSGGAAWRPESVPSCWPSVRLAGIMVGGSSSSSDPPGRELWRETPFEPERSSVITKGGNSQCQHGGGSHSVIYEKRTSESSRSRMEKNRNPPPAPVENKNGTRQ